MSEAPVEIRIVTHTDMPEPRKRKKKHLPKVVSSLEAERMIQAAATDAECTEPERVRNKLALTLMYRAGLRVSEVVSLAPRDIEADGIIRLYDAKGGDGTAYFDPESIMPLVAEWVGWRARFVPFARHDLPLLVMLPAARAMNTRYIQRLVKRLKEQLGIRGIVTPHVFRHTYATELLEEGFSLIEVQSALRHANLQTTAVYLHVRDESLRRKMTSRARHGAMNEGGESHAQEAL
jgi:site-specific recombinase XerD